MVNSSAMTLIWLECWVGHGQWWRIGWQPGDDELEGAYHEHVDVAEVRQTVVVPVACVLRTGSAHKASPKDKPGHRYTCKRKHHNEETQ